MSAFGPDPLPPVPPLRFDGRLQTSPEAAGIAVSRLEAIGTLSPDPSLFAYSLVRERAVLSARTEGPQLLPTF